MLRHFLVAVLVWGASSPLLAQPEGVRVSTWVREDLFAAYLADDADSLQRGVKKLDKILAERPDDVEALAWRASVDCYRSVKAHERGEQAEFERIYNRAIQTWLRLHEKAPDSVAVLAITAGSTSLFSSRLPEPQRTASFRLSRERFEQLFHAQRESFDKMPEHHRGEVLGGLAQAEYYLGNTEKAREYLSRIVETLAGSPYETSARRWLDDPDSVRSTKVACLSCHEPGRLANLHP